MRQPIIVFGASLKQDGTPHLVLIARIQAAIAYGKKCADPLYIVTGGRPRAGLSEAAVMKQLLIKAGVFKDQIICEDQATNTIQSIILCNTLLKELGFIKKQYPITLVSSAYHYPRCWWLMFLSGWRTSLAPAPLIAASRSLFKCWKRRLREIPAIIWDTYRFFFRFN